MTHKERMAALVEAGEKLGEAEARHEAECAEYERRMAAGIIPTGTHADQIGHEVSGLRKVAGTIAANARPSIALALEIVEALKEWRECERQMNNVLNNTNDYLNASNALGAAFKRLDELLAQWEEGT